MTIRSVRVVALLIPILAIGTGASLASEPTNAVVKSRHLAAFCPADPGLAARRTDRTPIHNRIAFKCHCCGRDENGHATISVAISMSG